MRPSNARSESRLGVTWAWAAARACRLNAGASEGTSTECCISTAAAAAPTPGDCAHGGPREKKLPVRWSPSDCQWQAAPSVGSEVELSGASFWSRASRPGLTAPGRQCSALQQRTPPPGSPAGRSERCQGGLTGIIFCRVHVCSLVCDLAKPALGTLSSSTMLKGIVRTGVGDATQCSPCASRDAVVLENSLA